MGKSLSTEEQNKILEMAGNGMEPMDIAKETGHTESTVNKLLSKQFVNALANVNKGAEVAIPDGEQGMIIKSMGNTAELSKTLLFNPQAAVQAGQMTGFNAATMIKTARRLYAGRGTEEEGEAFIGNVIGGILGLWKGTKSYNDVMPDEREAIRKATEQPDIEEIVKKALAEQSEQTANVVAQTIKKLKEEGVFK